MVVSTVEPSDGKQMCQNVRNGAVLLGFVRPRQRAGAVYR
jgi:hypothetical protein